MDQTRDFHNYKVWQDAVAYATYIYEVTSKMPYFEKKGLCDQLQRAVVSISSNIAEGSGHPSDGDFAHYLDIALGSAYEVETQLIIAGNVGYIKSDQLSDLLYKNKSIQSQLVALIRSIRKTNK